MEEWELKGREGGMERSEDGIVERREMEGKDEGK